MSRGVNKVILIGHLGSDPEVRYTAQGSAITSISIATSESWKDKQTGEPQERTEWHRIQLFGRPAEVAGEYLRKGSAVYVEGKLRTEEYEKDGIKHYTTKVIADQMQMLGSPSERSERAPSRRQPTTPSTSSSPTSDAFEDDDIPL